MPLPLGVDAPGYVHLTGRQSGWSRPEAMVSGRSPQEWIGMSISTSNGTDPRPLRVVIFGESIVSDWDNPAATSWRALLRALLAAGHDAVYEERRKNDAVVGLLRARGAGAMKAFGRRYPDILNRTYDLPRGAERSVWFGREVSTADAAIVLDDAPDGIFAEIAAYDTPRLVKVLARTGLDRALPVPDDRFDLVLEAETTRAVEIVPGVPTTERSGVLVVAYEDQVAADRVVEALGEFGPMPITPGRLGEPWEFVPEVEMPGRYGAAALAVLVGGRAERGVAERVLLAAASGCPTVAVGGPDWTDLPGLQIPTATVESVAAIVATTMGSSLAGPIVPSSFDAAVIAANLVQTIRRIRTERMGAFAMR